MITIHNGVIITDYLGSFGLISSCVNSNTFKPTNYVYSLIPTSTRDASLNEQ